MSDLPVKDTHFEGGQRVTPKDRSEGGAPLHLLINALGQEAEGILAMSAAVDLSSDTEDELKAVNRRLVTNAGAARAFTLPDFDTAPDGWEQTFISLDALTNELSIVHAGTDTINGIAGDIVLTTADHEWVKVAKVPGATGWFATGGTLVTPA